MVANAAKRNYRGNTHCLPEGLIFEPTKEANAETVDWTTRNGIFAEDGMVSRPATKIRWVRAKARSETARPFTNAGEPPRVRRPETALRRVSSHRPFSPAWLSTTNLRS